MAAAAAVPVRNIGGIAQNGPLELVESDRRDRHTYKCPPCAHRHAGHDKPSRGNNAGKKRIPMPFVHAIRDNAPNDEADATADGPQHRQPAHRHVAGDADGLNDLRNKEQHPEASGDYAQIVERQQQHLGIDHTLPQGEGPNPFLGGALRIEPRS